MGGIIIVIGKEGLGIVIRIDTLVADNGYLHTLGYMVNGGMKEGSKGVGCVNQQSDVFATAEFFHLTGIHASAESDAMM